MIKKRSFKLNTGLTFLGLGCLMVANSANGKAAETPNSPDADGVPHIVMETQLGEIVVELFPSAAPTTISKLIEVLDNPSIHDASGSNASTFNYTHSHYEIRTATLPALKDFEVAKEINGKALGIDEERVTEVGEATDLWQFEVYPAFVNGMKKKASTPTLRSWMDHWEEKQTTDFLMGASRMEVLEALGHTFVDNIDSRRSVKGSVMLKPASSVSSGPIISIAVDELPNRNGEWVVIGQVVEGLDLAHEISVRPNTMHNRPRHKPIEAVQIERVSVVTQ